MDDQPQKADEAKDGGVMRDIIFKAKRLDNGEWIQGDLRHWRSGRVGIHDEVTHRTIEVDPETVGEYSGLYDRNGKRIFEGDAVVYDNSPYNAYCTPISGVIVWRNGSLCFKHIEYGSAFYRSLCSDDFFAAKCEVIGNIHDTEKEREGAKDGKTDSV